MDDETRDDRNRRADGTYNYQPLLPEKVPHSGADAAQDAPFIWTDERAAATEGAAPLPTQRLVPATAGVSTPAWEWRGGTGEPAPTSTAPTPVPPGWYGTAGEAPAGPVTVPEAPPSGGWQRTTVGRWLLRSWPLLLFGLSKLKWLLVIFKFKAFTTFGSLLVSLWAYALFFGWQFAAGFIALLFIHELGHAAVMRAQGIKTTPILFVPFMGAVIGMREMPKNAFAEAQMALGGPILGSLGALGSLMLWQVTGAPIFVALAYSGFLLNLFNLIPVSPLDGGRAMAAISPWGWLVGLVLLVLLFLRVHSLILGFILIVGAMEVFKRWRSRHEERAYYEATGRQRLLVSAVYFGLAAFLALAMFSMQSHVLTNRPLN